jgi:hypothetical protein
MGLFLVENGSKKVKKGSFWPKKVKNGSRDFGQWSMDHRQFRKTIDYRPSTMVHPKKQKPGPTNDPGLYFGSWLGKLVPGCDALGQYHHVVVEVFYNAALYDKYFFVAAAAYHNLAVLQRGNDRSVAIQYLE